MGRFSGKKIVITGASSGIGLAGAKRITEEGGEVMITGRNLHKLEKLRTQLTHHTTLLQNDGAEPEAAQALAEAVESFGMLDGLWLNAGQLAFSSVENCSATQFDTIMANNARAAVLQVASLSRFLKEGASVVMTASTAAYEGTPMAAIYAASKGAQLALVRCWATAFAARGIRVNALVPGAIDTPLLDIIPAPFRAQYDAQINAGVPLKRSGTAEEAAAVALFLLSDDAGYVTGSQYVVDGGLLRL
ncbi:SDR family oxidoreductase [Cronobacter dublinensis subsp. dublinensis]|nr:SDR family oxidoreductase [Cronobacter dublinensis subsp. dublinensis]EGT5737750.1 SDR family oxidoreductase [Cronobacter dublinensis subsp. dublinensis]